MLIADIKPYERNARDNSKSIPAIAESIERFGFRGQIKLRSHDDPTIVAGHHRVEACKLLGWTEIPEENICWCDDLTEDEVKALRLADNRTGEGGKWNRAMVREEIRSLHDMDMSRFKFDFKSKARPYGAERKRTDDAYNLAIVNASHCDDETGMPPLLPVDAKPDALLPFNYAKTAKEGDKGKFLHFFIDDYQFERLWNRPQAYLELVKSFAGALTPDFSLYMDMPLPVQQWNEYRRRALGNYWQRNGVEVIPTLSWSDERSYGFCFGGLPRHSTCAVSTVGVKGDAAAMDIWGAGMEEAMRTLEPETVLLYGGNIGFDFGDAEVIEYAANAAFGGK